MNAAILDLGSQHQTATLGHCVHGVKNQVDEYFPELGRVAQEVWHGGQFQRGVDLDAFSTAFVAPSRSCEGQRVLDGLVHVHANPQVGVACGAVKLLQAAYYMRAVLSGGFQVCKEEFFAFAVKGCDVGLQQFSVAKHQHQGVVEVMGDSTCHHSQRAQAFLLHKLLLGCLQAPERLFELRGSPAHERFQAGVLQAEFTVQKTVF